jgi:hypothetical protein
MSRYRDTLYREIPDIGYLQYLTRYRVQYRDIPISGNHVPISGLARFQMSRMYRMLIHPQYIPGDLLMICNICFRNLKIIRKLSAGSRRRSRSSSGTYPISGPAAAGGGDTRYWDMSRYHPSRVSDGLPVQYRTRYRPGLNVPISGLVTSCPDSDIRFGNLKVPDADSDCRGGP